MFPKILLLAGFVSIALSAYGTCRADDAKNGIIALPFMFFVAAAVAKYLGI